jgi:REP element-mobilizing transposase RayT
MAKFKAQQLSLLNDKKQTVFGGSRLKSHPKRARPLSTKEPIHLVLRSEKARGAHSFLRVSKESRAIFDKTCAKRGVKIYKYANVGNHFHVVIRLGKRFSWNPFIRELTSRLAALVKGPTQFWTGRPFTRILHGWGKNFRTAMGYVVLNQMEAAGFLTRREVHAAYRASYRASG